MPTLCGRKSWQTLLLFMCFRYKLLMEIAYLAICWQTSPAGPKLANIPPSNLRGFCSPNRDEEVSPKALSLMPQGFEESSKIVRNEASARFRRPLRNQSIPGASKVIPRFIFRYFGAARALLGFGLLFLLFYCFIRNVASGCRY